MTLEAVSYAHEPNEAACDHKLTDEYAAALFAMARGEPEGRARLMRAYAQLREREPVSMPRA